MTHGHLTKLFAAVGCAATVALMAGTGVAAASPATATLPAVAAHSGWGSAKKVPHLGTLNVGRDAAVTAMACTSSGNCVAGGFYTDSHNQVQSWLAVQRKSTWGNAFEVPGTGALNAGGDGGLIAVRCPSAGNCVSTGAYESSGGAQDVFVESEHHGHWAKATALRGYASLDVGKDGAVNVLACAAAGDCTVGGNYLDGHGKTQAFLATEKKGHWAKAEKVPGSAALNSGGNAQVTFVSCRKVGYCTAGGDTQRGGSTFTVFVVSERKGHWGNAARLPDMSSLNTGGAAKLAAGSCSSAGNCVVGGSYLHGSDYEAYLDVQKNGHWHNAIEVPGTASLNKDFDAETTAASCASNGNCAVGGNYQNGSGQEELFLIRDRKGSWGKAREMPGLGSLNTGGNAQLNALSCSSAGNCASVGYYENTGSRQFAYTATESGGHWGSAKRVPGITTLANGGDSDLAAVVCKSAGHCTAGGFGETATPSGIGFVVTRS
jgi:hypothetical protein